MSDETAACRINMTDEDLAREADRAVLYGAILAAQRPGTRVKPHIAEAVNQLLPAVRAYLNGANDDLAVMALAYARACGGEAFLQQKRDAIISMASANKH